MSHARTASTLQLSAKRIVVIGSSGAGKTALTVQFVEKRFVDHHDPTIEDSYQKSLEVENEKFLLDIYDTSGDEIYSDMRMKNMRGAQGFIICFSINDRASFLAVRRFYQDIVNAYTCAKHSMSHIEVALASATASLSPSQRRPSIAPGNGARRASFMVQQPARRPSIIQVAGPPIAGHQRARSQSSNQQAASSSASVVPAIEVTTTQLTMQRDLGVGIILVGTKLDLEFQGERQVQAEEIYALSAELNIQYFEVTSKAYSAVAEVFSELTSICSEMNHETAAAVSCPYCQTSKHKRANSKGHARTLSRKETPGHVTLGGVGSPQSVSSPSSKRSQKVAPDDQQSGEEAPKSCCVIQ